MVRRCCASECQETYKKNSPISLHAFPKDPERRKCWTEMLNRENFVPSESSGICSKHFTEDSFDRNKFGGRWLKSTAVPTIFNLQGHLQSNLQPEDPEKSKCSDEIQSREEIVPTDYLQVCSKDVIEESSDRNRFGRCWGKTTTAPTIFYLLPHVQPKTSTEPEKSPVRSKRLRFLGDFKPDIAYSPEKLARRWDIACNLIKKQRKKIRNLQKQNRLLKKKLDKLAMVLNEQKRGNFISDVVEET